MYISTSYSAVECSPSPCQNRIEDDHPHNGDDNCSSSTSSPPRDILEACIGGTSDQLGRPALPLIVDYLSEATSYQALEKQVTQLQRQLKSQREQLAQKDLLLDKLQSSNDPRDPTRQADSVTEQMSCEADSYCEDYEQAASPIAHTSEQTTRCFSVEETSKTFSAWLFGEASLHEEISDFLLSYTDFLQNQGIPVHRLTLMAFVKQAPAFECWTWQQGELTKKSLNTSQVEGDPINMMEFWRSNTNQSFIRVRSDSQFRDYVSIPIRHKQTCRGGLAWSTTEDFSEEHITFLKESHAALCTVMRSYLNELKVEHLVDNLDDKIVERTRELEAANQELYQTNQRIKQQSGEQLKHFAMMSHELRTPLNGMIGLTSLLQNAVEDMAPDQAEIVEMIANSGDLLLRVCNDVLDYSKLTLGMVEITKEATRVVPVLEQVVDASRAKAQQRGIRIKTYFSPDAPSMINTDGRRLQQIVLNLINNAIKFSNDDGIVEVKVTKLSAMAGKEHKKPRLRIMVKDYGKGIDKSNFAKIFEPFQQADAETERTHGGTGLGLAITSNLVKSLGGSIAVDSEVGQWCVFSVELDLDETLKDDDEEELTPEVLRLSSTSLTLDRSSDLEGLGASKATIPRKSASPVFDSKMMESFRVLVAEDNRINQVLLKRTLDRLGVVNVDIVGDGSIAVEQCNETPYDLILMDMQMPQMDGIEATRSIRQHCLNSNASTKIIFVTAHALRDFEAKALEVGADGFLSKPYKFHSIKEIIEAVVHEKK